MMRVFNVKGRAKIKEVPLPQIGPYEVLIKNEYSAISPGTETKSMSPTKVGIIQKALQRKDLINLATKKAREEGIIKTYRFARSMLSSWHPLGYSSCGRVEGVGEQVKEVQTGELVACAGLGYASHASYVAVPKTMLVRVPPGVSSRDACMTTLGAIAIHALHRCQASFGEVVVVYGMGLLGNLVARIAMVAGCQVVGIDTDTNNLNRTKLHFNLEGGVDDIPKRIYDFTRGRGADAVIITAKSDDKAILTNSLYMCRKKGKVVVVGHVGLEIDRQPFYEKEIDVLVSRSYGPGRHEPSYEEGGVDIPLEYARWTIGRNMEEFLRLLMEKKVAVGDLIDEEYDLQDAEKAYISLQQENKPLGIVIKYPSSNAQDHEPIVIVPATKPQETYGIALVGGGNFAQDVHIPEIQRHHRLFLKTILTKNGYSAAKVASFYKIPQAASSYESILKDPEIDAVVIATPHSSHADYAVRAIGAGKHVFVEKPLALRWEECQKIKEALIKNPVVFTVGFNRTFSPLTSEAMRVFPQGSAMNINYRMQSVLNVSKGWVYDPEIGGGRIIGELCHIYDFLYHFTASRIVSISAQGIAYGLSSVGPERITGNNYSPDGNVNAAVVNDSVRVIDSINHDRAARSRLLNGENNLVVQVGFEDGSAATINYCEDGNKNLPKERIEIIGGGHVVVIVDFVEMEIDGQRKAGKLQKGFREHYEQFVAALSGEPSSLISIERALHVMECCFTTLHQIRGVRGQKR